MRIRADHWPGAISAAALIWTASLAAAQEAQVRMDASEAEAALGVLDAHAEGRDPGAAFTALVATRPYQRLKQREASLNRAFTDEEFAAFLASPATVERRTALRGTLERWRSIEVAGAAARAFAYLPEGAGLKAEVYFLVKPRPNSFVFEPSGDEAAVFLYLDPEKAPSEVDNIIAHELHHIGFAQNCSGPAPAGETEGARRVRAWSGAFGEGLAMMAAAGGPDVHPHDSSPPDARAVWDQSMTRFSADFAEQDVYFLKVLRGEAGDDRAVSSAMRAYFGVQGPWYTVGWKMAEVIERALGRPAVIDAFCRPGAVFSAYNRAARQLNLNGADLPLWNDTLAAALDPDQRQP